MFEKRSVDLAHDYSKFAFIRMKWHIHSSRYKGFLKKIKKSFAFSVFSLFVTSMRYIYLWSLRIFSAGQSKGETILDGI